MYAAVHSSASPQHSHFDTISREEEDVSSSSSSSSSSSGTVRENWENVSTMLSAMAATPVVVVSDAALRKLLWLFFSSEPDPLLQLPAAADPLAFANGVVDVATFACIIVSTAVPIDNFFPLN
jgi:hypothetical protein